MIKSRTVFVLGAGASAPYGFPLGRGLVDDAIIRLRQDDEPRVQMLQEICRCSRADLRSFADALERAVSPSIDAFLEGRPDYLELGKAVIAALLIPYEGENVPFSRTTDRGQRWYDYMLNRMGASPTEFVKNALSIVTFNYDRSLEYFILVALQNRYGITPREAADLLEQIPVVHLHGQLGSLPLLNDEPAQVRPYTAEVTTNAIRIAAASISVVHEDIGHYPQFERARDLLTAAQEIWLLGFGYYPVNVERLGKASFTATGRAHGLRLVGTAYDLLEAERYSAEVSVRSDEPNILELGQPTDDVLTLLRKKWD